MLDIDSIELFTSRKILKIERAGKIVSKFKKEGKKVGLCHGGFDLLHPGHIKHFESAKKMCDILIVSITSDKNVSRRKNSGRPIFTDKLRAYAVAAIEFVDYVIVSDFKHAIDPINLLKPSFYIKGPDFIYKTTPGITSERKVIGEIDGEIKYTRDPTLSTTKIIDYIKGKVSSIRVLLIIDRDGTIIENDDFLGKNDNWKEDVKLNKNVVDFLSYVQTKINPVNIVITNQAGVARGYFDCKRVEVINAYIGELLRKNHIMINNWQYCPDVDLDYAEKTMFDFKKEFTKKKTKRKPSTDMVYNALKELKMKLNDFNLMIVIGDRHEDEGLAERLHAQYIDVKEKNYDVLVEEFESKINK